MTVPTQIFFKLKETNKNQLKCIDLKTILTNELNQRMDTSYKKDIDSIVHDARETE